MPDSNMLLAIIAICTTLLLFEVTLYRVVQARRSHRARTRLARAIRERDQRNFALRTQLAAPPHLDEGSPPPGRVEDPLNA